MKSIIFLFCTISFALNPINGTGQNAEIIVDSDVTLNIKQVFRLINKQTDYKFIYRHDLLKTAPNIDLKKGVIKAGDLLDKCLSPISFTYNFTDGSTIVVKKRSTDSSESSSSRILDKKLQFQVSGSITDDEEIPLPGANILEKGTTNGTQADFDGNFSINVTNENAILVISFIGYATKEISVSGQSNITVNLKESTAGLDEVVVVGYGTIKKSDLTGAVSTVKAEDLPLSTNTSVEQALTSKAAGLTITTASGQPGAGVNILIRGAANVGASNAPLYVIDGFPVGGSIEQQNIGRFGDAGFRSPLNDINPNDIASIEILKDASATAIYGSRASNGVILITTKRGKEGVVKVEYSSNYTAQSTSKWLDLLDAQEYMTERNEVLIDHGDPAAYTLEEIANASQTTDWFDAISQSGFIHQQNISINGGTENTKYLSSINYFDQQGVIKNSDLNRITGRLNLDQKIGKHINFGLTLTASTIKNRNVPLGSGNNEFAAPLRSAIDFSPIPPIKDENGNFSRHPITSFSSTLANPVSLLDIQDETVTERLFANAFVDVKIVEGLNAGVKVGVDKRSATRNFYSPTTNIFGASENGTASKFFNKRNDQLFGFTLTYNRLFGDDHNLTVLGGYEYQEFNREGFNSGNNDFITDGLLFNDLNAGIGNPLVGSFKTFDELASYFGRLNYIFKDKYLLTASIRRDGSPNFGANNRWGVFPSTSLAWRIINENFMANQNTFSDLKLRVGYGQTGNNAITGATALYQTRGNYIYGATNQSPEFGVQQTRYENPDLKWQTNTEINAGLDFALFKNRISGSVDYFDKKVSDLLGTKQLKTFLPISQIAFNVGATKSSGVEVTLQTKNLTGNFKWDTGFNLGTYKDRWTERDPAAILQPYETDSDLLNAVWIYDYQGIQQIGDPIPAHQPNIKPGQPIVKDINGVDDEGNLIPGPDGQITPADRIFIGTTSPGFAYGISNNLSYKGLDLSFFLQGMGDRLRFNETRSFYLLRASSLREGRNVLAEFTDRWTPANTTSEIPAGTVDSTPGSADRLFWEDAGFLRLKNVTLGYTFQDKVFGNVVSKARIYVDAQNVFLITDYTGIDPEFDSIGAYPNQRSFTIGLNVTF
ncbi:MULTISPECIES: SusC/RagA family TonB-linked outer membrane protein [Arenibacter]|uniref:SusC/RagA family TonB-linked outer membrane protein n=1 Tax=Arenibacter TaxID=178469 RepID=UPI0012FFF4A5|nr:MULTISPECIES: TonB-dependent receptor [Arenibacter]